jgi:hypothetical protein
MDFVEDDAMKGTRVKFLRVALPLASVVALGLLTTACGDKSSDPDAVTVDELKYPGDLRIRDNGNGAVSLYWRAANNESDFDGFNVYGMNNSPSLGVTEGKALQLLGTDGEANADAKTTLSKFNFDPKEGKFEKAGSQTNADGEAEFSALPIHSLDTDGTTRLLPTCKPSSGTCAPTTAATLGKSVGDDATLAVNGVVSYDVSKVGTLTVGNEYCFLVLSSMDKGQKVSQTSSNAACVTPKYKTAFSLPASETAYKLFDLTKWLASCTAAAGCADPSTTFITDNGGTTGHKASDAGDVFLEKSATMIAGKGNAIADLGYYANGFSDDALPPKAPVAKIDTNVYDSGSGSADTPVYNVGYSLAGQSVPLVTKHMYVFAIADATGGTFHYYWMYVSGAVAAGSPVAVEMRLPK